MGTGPGARRPRNRRCFDARLDALGGHARALRRHRGQLARGDHPALLHRRVARSTPAAPSPPSRPTPTSTAGTANRSRPASSPRSTASPTPTAPARTPGATSSSTAKPATRPTTPVTVEPPWSCLERDEERAALRAAIDAGRIVVVSGEAGIGKTALVRAVATDGLWGGCDPLITPRPLGPLHDIARHTGGELAAALADGSREAVLAATLDELERTTLVIEDLHWADDATLDLVALVGRRLAPRVPHPHPPARPRGPRSRGCWRRCGRSGSSPGRSPRRRRRARRRRRRDARELHAATGGNPFFVTEALGSGDMTLALSDPRAGGSRARVGRPGRGRAVAGRPARGGDRRVHRRRAAADRRRREARLPPRPRAARRRGRHLPRPPPRPQQGRARGAGGPRPSGPGAARPPCPPRRRLRRDPPPRPRRRARRGRRRRPPPVARAVGGRARRERRRGRAGGRRRRGIRLRPPRAGDRGAAGADRAPRGRSAAARGRPALALAAAVVGGRRRRGAGGRRPGDRHARRLPAEPRAGDGAEHPVAAAHVARAARRGDRARRAGGRPGPHARRRRDARPRADERGHVLVGGRENERGRELLEEAYGIAVAGGHDDHAARALRQSPRRRSPAVATTRGSGTTSNGRWRSPSNASSTATTSTCSATERITT